MRAIFLALDSPLTPTDAAMSVHTDSHVVYWTIKARGSKTSRRLTLAYQEVLEVCLRKRIYLEPVRIPGSLNVLADSLSRAVPLPGEWRIDPHDWERVSLWKGPFQIDLMATPYNNVLPAFVSPINHPKALGVDVRMLDWDKWESIYIFPPPAMLQWVMERLYSYKGKAVVIARVPQHHPCLPIVQAMMRDKIPLQKPPYQMVLSQRVEDSGHWSCPWTAYLFYGQDYLFSGQSR